MKHKKGDIVNAHSIARAALSCIADKGHVYGLDADLMALHANQGMPVFTKIGINRASAFTGFCGFHDDRTFAPLEKTELIPTAEQCFLMGYRSVCREAFQKRLQLESITIFRSLDAGQPSARQEEMQATADLYEVGVLLPCRYPT
jgi:hypothetical protein